VVSEYVNTFFVFKFISNFCICNCKNGSDIYFEYEILILMVIN
jgi:hypothetical protein